MEARQGGGNYIKEQFEDSFFEPLSLTFLLHGSNIDEVIKFRQMMEPQAAGEAALRRSEKQLEEMKKLLCELKTSEKESVSAAIDKQLHYKIIEASGNKLVSYTMYAVSALVEDYIINTRSSMFKNPENINFLYKQHENIIHAIEQRDNAEAIKAMSEHLLSTYD